MARLQTEYHANVRFRLRESNRVFLQIKTALGLPKNRRNSPLFAALGIEKIDQLIKRQQLTLLRNALQGNSEARTFYMGMMRMYNQGNIDQYPASLLSRCKRICNSERFLLHKYIFDNKYETQCKRKLKSITRDGTVDSISNLLKNYNHDSKQLVIFCLNHTTNVVPSY